MTPARPTRWALDLVVDTFEWFDGAWRVVRRRRIPADPGERCRCRGACAHG